MQITTGRRERCWGTSPDGREDRADAFYFLSTPRTGFLVCRETGFLKRELWSNPELSAACFLYLVAL